MSIIQEIFLWTEGLPAWQSDAVARLLLNPELSSQDIDDLYALLKVSNGIADPKGRQPKPLTADQIPAPAAVMKHVELTGIKNLRNVNAIAENQLLAISASGMTVVYGDNGSGKSGYSRVLKRACRARDQSEPIHPNANLQGAKPGSAEATFGITLDGSAKEVAWHEGKVAPPELSTLSIFDSRCARAYLDSEDDFSYVPYGLDVFEALAKLCQQLRVETEKEQALSAVDLTVFAHLQGNTEVGKLIASLSASTKTSHIEGLATLSPEELARREVLEKSLKESNPKEKALQLRLRARRVLTLTKTAAGHAAIVGSDSVKKLKKLADSYRTAQVAATLAAKQFKEGEHLLPGSGGEAWRQLFDAAKKFALEAYPEKKFPDIGPDVPCPLCQQPLAEGAERLKRFQAFIEAEAEKAAQLHRQALEAECKPLLAQAMGLNFDDVMHAEIEAIDSKLASDIKQFEIELHARHEAIKNAVASFDWIGTDHPMNSPIDRLEVLAGKLQAEADALEKASNEEARVTLESEFAELDSRVRLSKIKDSVVMAVSKLSHQQKLRNCLQAVRTNSISLKASELAEKVVSAELAAALNKEFKLLGVGELSISLQSRVDKGKALHKLKLKLSQARSPADILSEGEQRAIAIGSFLAEVGLSGSKGGIVFDDPVSSLDHRRRERVARRLAAEAAKRQVIVLTHDIYFLCLLFEEAKLANISITTQSLTRTAEGFGVADPDLPFEGKSASKRVGALKAQQQAIAKLCKEGNEKEHRKQTIDAYVHLRMAWERAIEEVLLQDVVIRFRKSVETQRLSGVSVEDNDYQRITAAMSKCSNYAHDKALAGGVAVPDPDELLADIQELENWRVEVNKRSDETRKKRKSGTVAAT